MPVTQGSEGNPTPVLPAGEGVEYTVAAWDEECFALFAEGRDPSLCPACGRSGFYGPRVGPDGTRYRSCRFCGFYQGVDDATAAILQQMSAEVQDLCLALQQRFPSLELSAVRPLAQWLQRSYPEDILDFSSLQAMFNTNQSYAGLRVPVRPFAGGTQPDFQSRYLSEDVPYGLIPTRGIAELAGVEMPVIDRVILWAQARLDQEYLVAGKLRGRHLPATRAPQRYGIHSLQGLIDRVGLPA